MLDGAAVDRGALAWGGCVDATGRAGLACNFEVAGPDDAVSASGPPTCRGAAKERPHWTQNRRHCVSDGAPLLA